MDESATSGRRLRLDRGDGVRLAALGLGLYVALRYSLALWRADPDVAVPYAMLRGVQAHGLGFLTTWGYSPDNWLLSLFPLDALLYLLAPHHARLAVASGWAIFAASVFLAGAILAKLTSWRAGLTLSMALAFAGYHALGAAGFLTYPVTHNISMLWALLALWLAVHASQTPRRGVMAVGAVAMGLCLVVAGVSDPWATVAAALPIAVVSGALALWRRHTPERLPATLLCAGATVALLAGRTRLFGILGFLPKSPLTWTNAEGVAANAGWAFRALASMANIVPGANLEQGWPVVVDGLTLVAVFVLAAALFAAQLRTLSFAAQLAGGVAMVSVVGVLAAFLVGEWPRGLLVGRFFPNLYFFAPLLIGLVAAEGWARHLRVLKLALALYVGLFMLSGMASRPRLWATAAPPRSQADIQAMGDFLKANGLTYGYGPYWGSHALAMEWISAGQVTIRPVTFRDGHIARRHGETSPEWYRPGDAPAPAAPPFLIIVKDGEECPSIDACEAEAVRQFGPAARRLTYQDAVVLVWSRNISEKIAP